MKCDRPMEPMEPVHPVNHGMALSSPAATLALACLRYNQRSVQWLFSWCRRLVGSIEVCIPHVPRHRPARWLVMVAGPQRVAEPQPTNWDERRRCPSRLSTRRAQRLDAHRAPHLAISTLRDTAHAGLAAAATMSFVVVCALPNASEVRTRSKLDTQANSVGSSVAYVPIMSATDLHPVPSGDDRVFMQSPSLTGMYVEI